MSISVLQSSRSATDDWDALVASEMLRQAEIEAAFDRADACERLGDFPRAVGWLDRASELSGGLSPACRAQRARLARSRKEATTDGPTLGAPRQC
jgi:hypothetical protein